MRRKRAPKVKEPRASTIFDPEYCLNVASIVSGHC